MSTIPPGATVYIDHKRYHVRTPVVIRDLKPGAYTVHIEKKQFRSWQERITVSAGMASARNEILLLPEQLSIDTAIAQDCDDLIPLEQTPYFILCLGRTLDDCFVYDSREDKSWPLLRPDSRFAECVFVNSYTVAKTNAILLHAMDASRHRYFWVEIQKDQMSVKDVSSGIPDDATMFLWEKSRPQSIFAVSDTSVYRIHLGTMSAVKIVDKDMIAVGLFDRLLYVLRGNGLIEYFDAYANGPSVKSELTNMIVPEHKGVGRLIFVTSNQFIYQGKGTGNLLSNSFPFIVEERGVVGRPIMSMDKKKLLYWSRDRINIIPLGITPLTASGEKRHARSWRYVSKGSSIMHAVGILNMAYVLYQDKDKLFIIEADGLQDHKPEFLTNLRRNTVFYFSEDTGTVFYLDQRSGELRYFTLVPATENAFLSLKEGAHL